MALKMRMTGQTAESGAETGEHHDNVVRAFSSALPPVLTLFFVNMMGGGREGFSYGREFAMEYFYVRKFQILFRGEKN